MIFDFLLEFIFPATCVNCNNYTSNGKFICADCFSKIETFSGMFCGKCKARLSESKKNCHQDTPYILGAATSYENEAVRKMIHGLKFRSLPSLAEPLAQILVKYAKQEKVLADIVVPIPLGQKRMRERGYNQAELLANIVSRETGYLLLPCLRRTKETKPQSETENLEERLLNVSDCFETTTNLSGKNIILVDDVTTSGSTFLSAAKALKKAGAARVFALAVSRA